MWTRYDQSCKVEITILTQLLITQRGPPGARFGAVLPPKVCDTNNVSYLATVSLTMVLLQQPCGAGAALAGGHQGALSSKDFTLLMCKQCIL